MLSLCEFRPLESAVYLLFLTNSVTGMASSRVLSATRPVVRIATRNASNIHTDKTLLWKEINRLASEGKWDSINNTPKMTLFGSGRKEAQAAYNALNKSEDVFKQSAFGPYMKVIFRIALLLGIIKAGNIVYNFVVPEEKRLQYKYRHHGHHDDHAEHH